jgi:hypothetical protein
MHVLPAVFVGQPSRYPPRDSEADVESAETETVEAGEKLNSI